MFIPRPIRSTRRITLEADRARMIERRNDDPENLLHFQSTSDIVRYQPDPYILKHIVADLPGCNCTLWGSCRFHGRSTRPCYRVRMVFRHGTSCVS
jgi:hypothetical protein